MTVSTRSKKTASTPSTAHPVITKKRNPRPARVEKDDKSVSLPTSHVFPDLSLMSDSGQLCALHSLFTDDFPGLVLFTYPRANTPGCTTQAVGLSAFSKEANSLGYRIVGASYDSVKSQASWKAKLSLKCTLLCDTLDIGLLKKLRAHKETKSVKRSVFIIRKNDSDGKHDPVIVESKIVISPKDSISFVQSYVRENPCNKKVDAPSSDQAEQSAPQGDAPKPDGPANGKQPSMEADPSKPTSEEKVDSKDAGEV